MGNPKRCEMCGVIKIPNTKTRRGTIRKRYFEWANISGNYLRDTNDWIRLCIPCHKKYDNISEKVKAAWARKKQIK